MIRIVKPFDWENVRAGDLTVVIEGIDQPGYVIALYTTSEYFTVARGHRKVLAEAECEILPGNIGRAVIPAEGSWGSCVFDLIEPSGGVVLSSGVKLGAGEFTNWISHPRVNGKEGFRYPVLLVSSKISHTPGEVNCAVALESAFSGLCGMAPMPDCPLVGAVQLSIPTTFNSNNSLVLSFCIGIDEPEFADALINYEWTSLVPYIARFHKAIANVSNGFVMISDGMWSDSTVTPFFNDGELRQHPSLFRVQDRVGYLGTSIDEQEILAANGLDRFPGIPLLICNVGYRNHAHWILNSLLPAYLAREAIKAGDVCVIIPEHTDYIYATLNAIGIPPASILVAPRGFYSFTDVLFPSTLSTHVNRSIPPEAVEMFAAVRRHCLSRTRVRGPKFIYLTRQGSNAQRTISNEKHLIEALTQRGFVCIAPHELTFEQEVSCMSDAEIIVGQLGAAMINAAFAPRDAWLVEIASHNYISSDYMVLATTLGQKFVRILCRAPVADKVTLTDFSFEIPLDSAISSIDHICEVITKRSGVMFAPDFQGSH